MTILIAVETLLLVLLALLVIGLLRSHAEILRRLGPPSEEEGGRAAERLPRPPSRDAAGPAHDVAGVRLDGQTVQVGLGPGGPSTLLAFLSSGCSVCESFWEALQPQSRPEVPGAARLVIVTKDSSHESPSRLRELAPSDLPVIMSSAAWEAYRVPTAPYFVYVDGPSGEVHGEGSATAWPQVASLLRDALGDIELAKGATARALRIDRDLEDAGIGPGHHSLYPDQEEGR